MTELLCKGCGKKIDNVGEPYIIWQKRDWHEICFYEVHTDWKTQLPKKN